MHVCGWGVHRSLFPWGPGNSLAFICIKSECPGHARGVGGGVGLGVLNDMCIIVFASIYCLILSIEIILSLCFDVYFGRKIALRSDLVFDLCVFVQSLNFWDLWQLITSILHCYQQSELIKVTNLFLH